jgi:glycosyltransferase 2 family protein
VREVLLRIDRQRPKLITAVAMPNVRGAIAQTIHKKFGWSSVAVAISLVIVTIAAVTLFHVFRQIDLDRVIRALKTQSISHLLLSGAFVVAGYLTLTCYDVFALRAIGREEVPYRVAAFASFTSYTIGHNFGAAVFTSGLIRYRIYSAWGLSVGEIARIAFITGLTYWLANGFVLGAGVLLAPDAATAIDHLPAPINRLIGIGALAAIAGYLLWLLPRSRLIGRSRWQIVLPNAKSTLLQIGIGSMDLIFVALAMNMLLPARPAVGLLDLIVVFVIAMLMGVVSHVPGSLGVMEATMFIGLPKVGKEDLLVSLVTFRVLYFLVPLLLGTLLLGLREFRSVAAGIGRMS